MTAPTIILAAGGTGGHIFPAEALADTLLNQGMRPVLITDKRFSAYKGAEYKGPFTRMDVRFIKAGSLSGGLVKRFVSLALIKIGTLQAMWLMLKLKPKAVVGFGGYPSFPTMIAATILRVPTIIHEQNAVLGRTNRFLAKFVKSIATSFADTHHISKKHRPKVTLTGNPVRTPIRALHSVPYPELQADGILRLLVIGGSQGATVFSKVMPKALELLPAQLRGRIRIDQQCRGAELVTTRAEYEALGVHADLAPFFHDMAARLASVHLVISRAGASTVSELCVAGRPAILVPYPAAMDHHQKLNAEAVDVAGGGWLIPQDAFTPETISTRLEAFLNLPSSLTKAANNIRAIGSVGAAEELAALVLKVTGAEKKHTETSMRIAA